MKPSYGWQTPATSISSVGIDSSNNGIDTHFIKNVEWGAVAYLSTSQYGQKHSLTGGTFYGYPDKYPGEISAVYGTSTISAYATSTTGNAYGVYDMSGAAEEMVSAVYKNTSGTTYGLDAESSLIKLADDRYKDIYTTTNLYNSTETRIARDAAYGDAGGEVAGHSTSSLWFRDAFYLPSQANGDFISRGGHGNGVSTSTSSGSGGNSLSNYLIGVYASSYQYGGPGRAFRPVLIVNQGI